MAESATLPRVFLLAALFLTACVERGWAEGELGKLELRTTLPALDGRVLLQLPDSAKAEARQSSAMGTAESSESESRFVITSGEERLVVMVWELFALAPADLLVAAKAELGDDVPPAEVAMLTVADPQLRAVRVRPETPQLEQNAAMVDSAYLALADGSALSAAVYANAAALNDLPGTRSLAAKILSSARGGTRQLARQAGTRVLGELTMTVPADMVLSSQAGPDFDVYFLRRLRMLGAPPSGTIGVYVGGFPKYIHARSEYASWAVAKVPGHLFGRSVDWDSWRTPEGMRTQELIEPIIVQQPERLVHIFITSQDPAQVDALRHTAESLAVAEKL